MNGMMGGGSVIWWAIGVLLIVFLVVATMKLLQKR
jgi:hypothetical protein